MSGGGEGESMSPLFSYKSKFQNCALIKTSLDIELFQMGLMVGHYRLKFFL